MSERPHILVVGSVMADMTVWVDRVPASGETVVGSSFLLGFGGESPEGRLHAWLNIGVDELASPSLPRNIAAFMPHHVEIKPSLSGVLTADLHKLALDATEESADADSLAPAIAAIFSLPTQIPRFPSIRAAAMPYSATVRISTSSSFVTYFRTSRLPSPRWRIG